MIRSNNLEPRTNSEYFIVDRQYATGKDRLDLMGIYWPLKNRQREWDIVPCFIELKFAQNADIGQIAQQLQRYYDMVAQEPEKIAREIKQILQQKLDLGLFNQDKDRLAAMTKLCVSAELEQFQFIVVLVDYSPNSTLLDVEKLKALPFAGQIKLFRTGFAMWEQSIRSVSETPTR